MTFNQVTGIVLARATVADVVFRLSRFSINTYLGYILYCARGKMTTLQSWKIYRLVGPRWPRFAQKPNQRVQAEERNLCPFPTCDLLDLAIGLQWLKVSKGA